MEMFALKSEAALLILQMTPSVMKYRRVFLCESDFCR